LILDDPISSSNGARQGL